MNIGFTVVGAGKVRQAIVGYASYRKSWLQAFRRATPSLPGPRSDSQQTPHPERQGRPLQSAKFGENVAH
jgi:hypothetical protein